MSRKRKARDSADAEENPGVSTQSTRGRGAPPARRGRGRGRGRDEGDPPTEEGVLPVQDEQPTTETPPAVEDSEGEQDLTFLDQYELPGEDEAGLAPAQDAAVALGQDAVPAGDAGELDFNFDDLDSYMDIDNLTRVDPAPASHSEAPIVSADPHPAPSDTAGFEPAPLPATAPAPALTFGGMGASASSSNSGSRSSSAGPSAGPSNSGAVQDLYLALTPGPFTGLQSILEAYGLEGVNLHPQQLTFVYRSLFLERILALKDDSPVICLLDLFLLSLTTLADKGRTTVGLDVGERLDEALRNINSAGDAIHRSLHIPYPLDGTVPQPQRDQWRRALAYYRLFTALLSNVEK